MSGSTTLQPGQSLGPYRLVGLISRGGMGEVWRATKEGQGAWKKEVALKVMLPMAGDQAAFLQQFEREARVAALLDHPNVVGTFNFGRDDGHPWIEQELVLGEDVRRVLRRARFGVPPALALFITGEVLKALEYAFSRPGEDGRPLAIIHRDVKPSNVLCAYAGHVKLADFGIAKITAQGSGTILGLRGTAGYLAPEELDGKRASPRSDVFAAGLVLWELVTGRPLFEGDSEGERMKKTFECEIPPLASMRPEVPQAIELLLRRMLARDPADRFAHAGDALEALVTTPAGPRPATSFDLKQFLASLPPWAGAPEAAESRAASVHVMDGPTQIDMPAVAAEPSPISLPPPIQPPPSAAPASARPQPALPPLISPPPIHSPPIAPSVRAGEIAARAVAPPDLRSGERVRKLTPEQATVLLDGSARAPVPTMNLDPPGAAPGAIHRASTAEMPRTSLPAPLLVAPPPIETPPRPLGTGASAPASSSSPVVGSGFAPLATPGAPASSSVVLPQRPALGRGRPSARGSSAPPSRRPERPASSSTTDELGLPPPAPADARKKLVLAGVASTLLLAGVVVAIVALAGGRPRAPSPAPLVTPPTETAPAPKPAPPPEPTRGAATGGTAQLQLIVTPEDARVFSDRRPLPGRSPFVLSEVDTRWSLHVHAERAGYAPHDEDLQVKPPRQTVTIRLEHLPPSGSGPIPAAPHVHTHDTPKPSSPPPARPADSRPPDKELLKPNF